MTGVFVVLILSILSTDSPLDQAVKIYEYGLCLYIRDHRRLPQLDSPLFRVLETMSANDELMRLCKGDEISIDPSLVSHYRVENAPKDVALADTVAELFRSSGYYDLENDPLFVAARDLNMHWLVDKFNEPLKLICSDGVIHEKKWILEKLAYFDTSTGFNKRISKENEVNWKNLYSRGTVDAFLKLIKGGQLDIDCDAFYNLLKFIHPNVLEDDMKTRLYSGLARYGLLGMHSGDIVAAPWDCDITSIMESIEARWWYVMLMQVAREFGIRMTVDGASVELSSGYCHDDLPDVDFTKIKMLKYNMYIDLGTVVDHAPLFDALMFIFDRLDGISEFVFTGEPSESLDTSVFSGVFASLSGVTELTFANMAESSFRRIISILDLSDIRGLHTSYFVLMDDLSFIMRPVSLERLSMRVHGSSLALLGALPQVQGLSELNLSHNNFSDLSDFAFVAKFPSLVKLDLSYCKLTSASLDTLSGIEELKNLSELNLSHNNFSDLSDFAFVAKFPSLVKLDLTYCDLTSASLDTPSGIEAHKNLSELNLSYNNFSDLSDLAFIAEFPSLVKLDLSYCKLTSVSLNTPSGIEAHKNLSELNLRGNYFSDLYDLTFVAKFPSLVKLNLSYCDLTSASLNTLSRIEAHKNLSELNLSYNNFSDLSDFAFVAKFPSLKKLDIYGSGLPPQSRIRISELMQGRVRI